MRPIALITDFGTRDPYVGAMKGVIAARTAAPIHDLTHEIAPFDVLEAAWFLKTVVPWWPVGTIFVCVVDPGVGTSRKIVAAEANGHVYLAPDNGLLTFALHGGAAPASGAESFPAAEAAAAPQGVPPALAGHPARPPDPAGHDPAGHDARRLAGETPAPRAVEREDLYLPTTSTTFHGRDRFAPVAAAIANGLDISELGPVIEPTRLAYEPPVYGRVTRGTIVAVDRFGNLITDIEAARVGPPFELRVKGLVIDTVETTYAGPGPFLIVGSSGHLEISVANGSAADALQLRRMERVELCQRGNGAAGS